MKKKILVCFICILSFKLFANVSWELGAKGKVTCSYTNLSLQTDNIQYLDFTSLLGADVTFCFNRFIGLNLTVGPTYGLFSIDFENETPDFYISNLRFFGGDFGLVVMVPFNPKFKLRTEFGVGYYGYTKAQEKKPEINKTFSYFGYTGSIGFVITPIKHLCIGFGADYSFCEFTAGSKFDNSEYFYKYPGYNIMVCPYVTVAARLGKNLK